MIARIGFVACGMLSLTLALIGAWAAWHDTPPHNAWTLDEPIRTLTDFTPREKLNVSFPLRNTARVPLRILGASAC